jgi:hypothetical protein
VGYHRAMTLAAVLFLIAGVLGVVSIFVVSPRYNLLAGAVALTAFGLFCSTAGIGS